jgi:hypothetical protein
MQIKLIPRDCIDPKSWCGLSVWHKPQDFHVYAIGADVAEGVQGDASCAQVVDCNTGVHVASYWSNCVDTDNYSAVLYKLGYWFNKATICIEQNNPGQAVIAHLGGALGGLTYPNLYKRLTFDEYTQKQTKKIGFKTTTSTKRRIIENLNSALRDGAITTQDSNTVLELTNFVRDIKTGRMAAGGKAHDDRVMALALAWEQARITIELKNTMQGEEHQVIKYDPDTGFPI